MLVNKLLLYLFTVYLMLSTNVYIHPRGSGPKIHYTSFCSSLQIEGKALVLWFYHVFQKNYSISSLLQGFPGCHKPTEMTKCGLTQCHILCPSPSLSLRLSRWISGQTDVSCRQKASPVVLLMKRNGCRVNVTLLRVRH